MRAFLHQLNDEQNGKRHCKDIRIKKVIVVMTEKQMTISAEVVRAVSGYMKGFTFKRTNEISPQSHIIEPSTNNIL